jgi:hypothetical protein
MTGFFDDLMFETPEQSAARARTAFEAAEGDRRLIAELLAARGQRQAAALVALSTLEAVHVDNWDGGQYEAHLSVPVALYDRVAGELADQIAAAAEAVIGAGHYRGLEVGIRRPDYRDGWDRDLIDTLLDTARGEPPATGVPALPPAAN